MPVGENEKMSISNIAFLKKETDFTVLILINSLENIDRYVIHKGSDIYTYENIEDVENTLLQHPVVKYEVSKREHSYYADIWI